MVSRNLLSLMEEDALEVAARGNSAPNEAGIAATKRRSWDDDFVLKRQFSALIPAFDPRPGRTNVNQTTGIVLYTLTFTLEFYYNNVMLIKSIF